MTNKVESEVKVSAEPELCLKHGLCGSNDKSSVLTVAHLTAHEEHWSPRQDLLGHSRHGLI